MPVGSLRGRLLLATPPLTDPNFDRSVVLLLEHSDEGAVGVVLNRPSSTSLAEALPDWHLVAAPPAVVYIGGPVAPEALIGLAQGADTASDAESFTPLLGTTGTVDLGRDPRLSPGLEFVRVFAGYAGWAPGQLEGELGARAWIIADLASEDPFTRDPGELWRVVLIRQGGELAVLGRLYPDDVSHN